MGVKGDKNTDQANLAVQEIASKLDPIGNITTKKMFGGHGVFHDGKMFGIVDSKGNAFFKASELNADAYLSKGSSKHSRMPYYSIPDAIYEDSVQFIQWANTSIDSSK